MRLTRRFAHAYSGSPSERAECDFFFPDGRRQLKKNDSIAASSFEDSLPEPETSQAIVRERLSIKIEKIAFDPTERRMKRTMR
jgi:hypothetical protein